MIGSLEDREKKAKDLSADQSKTDFPKIHDTTLDVPVDHVAVRLMKFLIKTWDIWVPSQASLLWVGQAAKCCSKAFGAIGTLFNCVHDHCTR